MLTNADLLRYFESGCKTKDNFKIGVEHEQFIFKNVSSTHGDSEPLISSLSLKRASYEEKGGIRDLLLYMRKFGYIEVREFETVIGLHHPVLGHNISLEPGGQFEISLSPQKDLRGVERELRHYFEILEQALNNLGLISKRQGIDDISMPSEIPWMPKQRYKIMRSYMPKVGTKGLEMMQRTSTTQVNLDFESEQDMVRKMRVAMALQPAAIAYFSNSVYTHQGTLYKSYRTHIWQHTDSARSGLLKIVFDKDFGFQKYIDYLLSVPMYFLKREGRYIDVQGSSFKDFMKGELLDAPGEFADLTDFEDQVSIAFPEVRLKKYLEIRGCDSGDFAHSMLISQFWYNVFYNDDLFSYLEKDLESINFQSLLATYSQIPLKGREVMFNGQTAHKYINSLFDKMDMKAVA